jgi:hypothetical protein
MLTRADVEQWSLEIEMHMQSVQLLLFLCFGKCSGMEIVMKWHMVVSIHYSLNFFSLMSDLIVDVMVRLEGEKGKL